MALLLDTHALLWFIADDPRLSPEATAQIADPATRVVVSVASLWEMVIKVGTGKLELDRPVGALWQDSLAANGFEELPVLARHVVRVGSLPPHHRDPFDRLLIAQAVEEGLSLVSADSLLSNYPVSRVW